MKQDTVLLLLAAGAGVWLYMYYQKNGVFPWQTAPVIGPTSAAPSVSTTSTADNLGISTQAPQASAPVVAPQMQTLAPTTADTTAPLIQVIDTTSDSSAPATMVRDAATGNFFTLQASGKLVPVNVSTVQTATLAPVVKPKPVILTSPGAALSGVTTRRGRLGNICG